MSYHNRVYHQGTPISDQSTEQCWHLSSFLFWFMEGAPDSIKIMENFMCTASMGRAFMDDVLAEDDDDRTHYMFYTSQTQNCIMEQLKQDPDEIEILWHTGNNSNNGNNGNNGNNSNNGNTDDTITLLEPYLDSLPMISYKIYGSSIHMWVKVRDPASGTTG